MVWPITYARPQQYGTSMLGRAWEQVNAVGGGTATAKVTPPPKGGVLSSSRAPEKALQLHMPANQRPATASFALGRFDTNTLEDRIMNLLATASRCRKTWTRASALVALGLLIATCLGVQVTQPHISNVVACPKRIISRQNGSMDRL